MTDILQKDLINETSLTTTESSFTGLHRPLKQSSIGQTVIQHPFKLTLQPNAHQSMPITEISHCRICLQSEAESGQTFITPCNCTGTVQYIHLTCFTQWIRTSLTNKQNKELQQIQQSGLKCDLCKMSLEISMCMQKTFVGFPKLKQRIKKSPLYFSILTFMLISTIVLMCFSAAMLPSSPFTFPSQLQSQITEIKEKALQKVTMFCSLIVSIILLFFMVFLFVRDFLIAHRMKVWSSGKNNMKIELKGILKY